MSTPTRAQQAMERRAPGPRIALHVAPSDGPAPPLQAYSRALPASSSVWLGCLGKPVSTSPGGTTASGDATGGKEMQAVLDGLTRMFADAEHAEVERARLADLIKHGAEEVARREREQHEREQAALQAERQAVLAVAEAREQVARDRVEAPTAQLAEAVAEGLEAVASAATARNLRDTGGVGGNMAAYGAFRSPVAGRIALVLRDAGRLGTALDHSTLGGNMLHFPS